MTFISMNDSPKKNNREIANDNAIAARLVIAEHHSDHLCRWMEEVSASWVWSSGLPAESGSHHYLVMNRLWTKMYLLFHMTDSVFYHSKKKILRGNILPMFFTVNKSLKLNYWIFSAAKMISLLNSFSVRKHISRKIPAGMTWDFVAWHCNLAAGL